MPSKYSPEILDIEKSDKAVSARELSRKEFYLYLFGGLIEAMYVIGCMFLDGVILDYALNLFYSGSFVNSTFKFAGITVNFFEYYVGAGLLLLELVLIYFQVKYFRRKLIRLGKSKRD